MTFNNFSNLQEKSTLSKHSKNGAPITSILAIMTTIYLYTYESKMLKIMKLKN